MSDDAPVVFDKYRGEVPFKYLPGAVFRYRLKDLSALSARFGSDYATKLSDAISKHDAAVIGVFVDAGLKQPGGGKFMPPEDVDFDDPPWPLSAVYAPIQQAIMFSITGMTAEEAEVAEKAAIERMRAEIEKEFPPGPSDGQATSSSAPAGKESASA